MTKTHRTRVLIVRVLFPNFAHRRRVRFIERLAIFRLWICVTLTQRLDQRPLDRRRLFDILLREDICSCCNIVCRSA